MRKITPKQTRFVDEYMKDFNATRAAERAEYGTGAAGHLMRHPGVQAEIQRRQQQLSDTLMITKERVLQEYARIAFSDITDVASWDEEDVRFHPSDTLSKNVRRAIASISSKRTTLHSEAGLVEELKLDLRMHSKKAALDALGKHLGLFVDRIELTGANGGPLQTELAALSPAELLQRRKDALREAAHDDSA